MTTQLSLLDRARQGDAGAIAALMNDVLTTQAVWVKATLDADCLQVMLKAPATLNQATCVAFIRRGLLHLQPEAIAQVRAYAWRVGDAFPLWIATFALEQPSMERLVSTPPAPLLQPTQLGASHTNVTSSLHQPAQTLTLPPSTTVRQRSDFLKLSFVIVLATMIYFVVASV
jgi:hypothetical protein